MKAGRRKTVLVTGAFGGIGEATARLFAQNGWRVFATGRDKSKYLNQDGVTCLPLEVTDQGQRADVFSEILNAGGGLDCLVNNAGFGLMGPVLDATDEQVATQFQVNTIAPIAMMREALPLFRVNGGGRVINISSGLGRFVFPGTGIYAASKFALEALSDALRVELQAEGPDYKCILVEPGVIQTRFNENVRAAGSGEGPLARQLREVRLKYNHRRKKAARPEDVAHVIFNAATARRPRARYVVTIEAWISIQLFRWLPAHFLDRVMTRLLGIKPNG